jgi:hypothetical protein
MVTCDLLGDALESSQRSVRLSGGVGESGYGRSVRRGVRSRPRLGGSGHGRGIAGAGPASAVATERLNLAYHAILGLAMGAVAVATVFAWIPAIPMGIVIGRAAVEQAKGIRPRATTQIVRLLAVTGGVIAMLVLGLVLGGIVAFVVASLAAFSERLAANAGPNDQTIARILTTLVAAGTWFVLAILLNIRISFTLGG